jgi:hypothetical protein
LSYTLAVPCSVDLENGREHDGNICKKKIQRPQPRKKASATTNNLIVSYVNLP